MTMQNVNEMRCWTPMNGNTMQPRQIIAAAVVPALMHMDEDDQDNLNQDRATKMRLSPDLTFEGSADSPAQASIMKPKISL
jgi:hypothetical protein